MKQQPEAISTPPGDEKDEAARSEIREFLDISRQRRMIFPRAALVGLCAGLVALAFRAALTGADHLRMEMMAWACGRPAWGWLFAIGLTALGAALAVALTRRYAPEAAGSGIPHLEAVLHRIRELRWRRLLPVKFAGGVMAIGSGLALGREGPTVQMGGAVGAAIARLLRTPERERLTLISAGAGAGLAAAFNAPLSGLVFVLEEVRRDFQPIVFGAAFLAAAVADIVARIGSGQFPVFSVPAYPIPPLSSMPVFALLGVAAGLLGVAFNRSLLATIRAYARIPSRWVVPAAAVTGGLVGLAGWFSPGLIGSGHALAESTLKGEIVLGAIPLLFAARFLLTTASYGTGAPGGIFAPLLVLGALLGLAVGQVAHHLMPAVVPVPAAFAVVGMAAFFTAIVRAPLTGIMLILEMTGNYSQMLPLLVSCFCAYATAEHVKELPIYEALLQRDLGNAGKATFLKVPVVMDFIIQHNAPFAGREIRELGLPSGCILVRCAEGSREWVPTADTRLMPHMSVTAVVAPEAAEAVTLLRIGCGTVRECPPLDPAR